MTPPGRVSTPRRAHARLTGVVAAALTALCAGILTSAQPAFAASFVPINGAGSTWSANAIDNWATSVAALGMTVNYSPAGMTSGRQEFSNDIVDWAASEIPYGVHDGPTFDPPPTRGYTYVPDTAGGVAFMYNLHIGGQQVTNLRLSGPVIAGIFTNQITTWNDPKIAADNPGLTLPAEPIAPVVRTDASGATWAFTQWMLATQPSSWTAYCAVVGRSPCTQTAAYPVQPGTAMIGQSGDLGVSGYVSQSSAEGAIGYVEYSYALQTGFPVAKVLNAAGYYTAPTGDNVGVSLLNAQVINDITNPLNQTEDLSGVYTDGDPRTYELSYYSYLIVPTDLSTPMTTAKGYTLGAFGQYLLCHGQQAVDGLGYAALPINLVEAGFTQLQKIPGNLLPATTAAFISGCDNPTFSPDGTNLLTYAPMPQACDRQGSTQCTGTTAGQISTTTTLTASPEPATAGSTVTLTATESAADGTTPAGTVQFGVGGTDIGVPVTASTAGAATTNAMFAAGGTQSLWALFVPASSTYAVSEGTLSLQVTAPTAGQLPIMVSVPQVGTLTVTVSTTAINLAVQGMTTPLTATGALNTVSLSDTRNTVPGWSVSGQDTAFTGNGTAAGSTFSGDTLGWTPSGTVSGGATLGPAVAPGANPGLQDAAQVLASAAAGSGLGTDSLSAALTLDIPAIALAGPYTSTLTITYLLTGP